MDGERVQCHECGRWLKRISGRHLQDTHGGMTGEEYRRRHGLAVTNPLMAPAISARYAASWLRSPGNLKPMAATAAARASRASARAAATRADWAGRQERRQRGRRVQPLGSAAGVHRTRQRMEQVVRSQGYEDLATYLQATAGLTDREVAAQLGVGRSTVSRERQAVLGRRRPGPRPSA